MRAAIHGQQVKFRVNEALLAKAEEIAAERGMSLSELMRQAVRNELKASDAEDAKRLRIPLQIGVWGGSLSPTQYERIQEPFTRKAAEDGSYQNLSEFAYCLYAIGVDSFHYGSPDVALRYFEEARPLIARLLQHPDRPDGCGWDGRLSEVDRYLATYGAKVEGL